jgi:hypothetical protein
VKTGTTHLCCGLLLLTLSTAVLAQDSLTARIPVAIAAGEYAEAETLVSEAFKIGLISSATAAAYRREVQQARERAAANKNKPGPDWIPPPHPSEPTLEPDKDTQEEQGRIYVTYTKFNKNTHRYYSGRTSMVVDRNKPLSPQALKAIELRDANHHLDENDEPNDPAFGPARMDKSDIGTAVDYSDRYRDAAYLRIRGREQQLIDSFGGAWSDTGKPYKTENAVRGVAKDNPQGRSFYDAATSYWGKKSDYTGY